MCRNAHKNRIFSFIKGKGAVLFPDYGSRKVA